MRVRFPELDMQQVDLKFITFGGIDWVVYTAAAYRTPDDPRPGHGTAWERVPGTTPYTRNSELQNAETAAWGRALVAIGADTKTGIASAEEIESRRDGGDQSREFTPLQTMKQGLMGVDPDPIERKKFVLEVLARPTLGSLEELDEKDIAVVIQAIGVRLSRRPAGEASEISSSAVETK